jgi:hypothetical protein
MAFNLKALIRKANTYNVPQVVIEKPVETKPVEYVNPMYEPKQEIEIPLYEPDSEPEIDNAPVKKKTKNENIARKVSLNPLSD